jgi:hypothetical protein
VRPYDAQGRLYVSDDICGLRCLRSRHLCCSAKPALFKRVLLCTYLNFRSVCLQCAHITQQVTDVPAQLRLLTGRDTDATNPTDDTASR